MTAKRLLACTLLLVLFAGCWNPMRRKEEKIKKEFLKLEQELQEENENMRRAKIKEM